MIRPITRPRFRYVFSDKNEMSSLYLRELPKIQRVGQSARILPIHVKEGDKHKKSTSFFHFCKRQESGHEKSGK